MAKIIAVAGKGGVGKTTLTGLMIQYLCKNGKTPILAVDADANSNLNEVLGVEAPPSLGEIREEIERAGMSLNSPIPAGMAKGDYLQMRLEDAITEEKDFDLMVMGRTQGQGCYCFVNGLVQTQIQRLQANYPYLVVDNEAGMEHISRGLLPTMDVAILVSDCSRRGVQAAGRIAALMQELNFKPKQMGLMEKKVLVVDSDESNFGLHRQLGVELPRDFTEYFGGKDKAFKTMMTSGILDSMKLSAFAKKFFSEDFTMADIPEEYYSEKDGVKLMSSGKIHKANEGCACTMNSILEQFVAHLTLAEDEIALLDMEAGVEHFGRGTDNSVDGILMIVDPSFESLRLSVKIADLSTSIGKPIWFCLNKLTEETAPMMEEEVGKHGAIIGRMPLDHDLGLAGLTGTELQMTIAPVREMAQFLIH